MSSIPSANTLLEASSLEALNGLLEPISMRAGWNKHEPSLWPQPRTGFRPAAWSWNKAKSALDAAGRLIDTDKADRRNLFMVNPKEGNYYASLRTLVCAYQMILPGERARSHRHTPGALRLALEMGEDCYTVVDGIRIDMHPNDVVLTPNWSWHGHANDGTQPGYWIDYLDTPLVHLLEPMFLEAWPGEIQAAETCQIPSGLVFKWSDSEERLRHTAADENNLRHISLETQLLPTIALSMTAFPAGGLQPARRTTVSQIFTVVKGRGQSVVGDRTFTWSRGDVVVVPSWTAFSHHADEPSILFCVSDLPVMERLGFLRSEAV